MKYIKLFESLSLVKMIKEEEYQKIVFSRNEDVEPLSIKDMLNKEKVNKARKQIYKNTKVLNFNKSEVKLLEGYGFKSYSDIKRDYRPQHPSLAMRDGMWKGHPIASAISGTGETYILDRISKDNSYIIVNKLDDDYFYVKYSIYNRSTRRGRLGYMYKFYKCDQIDGLKECLNSIIH